MSGFSGKCDLADIFCNHDDEHIANSTFYIFAGNRDHRLDIHCRRDLIPYYPFLVGSMGSQKDKAVCYISSESFVDREEREHMEWILKDAIKYYKKCKRKKIEYKEEEALKNIVWFNKKPTEWESKIVHRVAADGEKANIEGIHDSYHDYYRKQLYEEMIENDYSKEEAFKWCYGWGRMFDLNKKGMTVDEFFAEKGD